MKYILLLDYEGLGVNFVELDSLEEAVEERKRWACPTRIVIDIDQIPEFLQEAGNLENRLDYDVRLLQKYAGSLE